MNILTCLKSQRSILKIQNNYSDINFENIREYEELQEKIIFSNWDMAIIDNKIFFDDNQMQEAIKLLEDKKIKVLLFEGDFELIFEQLDSILNISEVENEAEAEAEIDDTPIRYIEKETIVEKEVIKEVKVKEYKHMYSSIANKNIGIMNLSKGAGSTFITINLAKALTEYEILTSVIELPLEQPKIYTNIGIEQRFTEHDELGYLDFFSFQHAIDVNNKIEKDKETYIDDVIFIVPDPHKENIKSETWNFNKMIKLLNVSRKAKFNLIDINNSFEHESVKDFLLEELDMLIVVIDPNPTEIILNMDKLEKIKELESKNIVDIKYVLNKFNSGVDLKELQKIDLDLKLITKIPYIDVSLVYKALYKCEFLFDEKEAKTIFQEAFIPLFKELIPIDLIKANKIKTDETVKKKKFQFFKKK